MLFDWDVHSCGKKVISIFSDLEKKNVSSKLCTYIKDFMRLAKYREALEEKHHHT